jgi:NADH dehydrogenase [ubiquinone] 1 alpha subcomplex assembly factor 1
MKSRDLLLGALVTMASSNTLAVDLDQVENMKSNTISVPLIKEQRIDDWQVTNDGVMGGLSLGYTQLENETFIFSGKVSTENNGGFTSVFKKVPELSDNIKSISICIMGDGKPYQLRVRSQVMGYELAYKIGFSTRLNTLETHTFNLANFKASFRGRNIDNAPILTATSISHVGFLVTAEQTQNFSLSVCGIEFVE